MNFQHQDKTSSQNLTRIINQSLDLQDIRSLRRNIRNDIRNISLNMNFFYQQIVQRNQQIYQYQLQDLHSLLLPTQSFQKEIYSKNFTNKLLKFFSPQFNSKPQTQQRAFCLYQLMLPPKQPLTLQQVKRVVSSVTLQNEGYWTFAKLVSILKHPQQKLNIIDYLLQIETVQHVQKLTEADISCQQVGSFTLITFQHLNRFREYLYKLQTQNIQIQQSIYMRANQKLLKFVHMSLKYLGRHISNNDKLNIVRCLSQVYNIVPVLKYDFQNHYLGDGEIDQIKYNIQKQVSDLIYNAGFLNMLQQFKQANVLCTTQIWNVLGMMLLSISVQQFRQKVIPFIIFKFSQHSNLSNVKNQCFIDKNLSQLLVKFLLLNNLNRQQNIDFIKQNFTANQNTSPYCSILQRILGLIQYKSYRLCYYRQTLTQQDKNQNKFIHEEIQLNYFYLILLGFQIVFKGNIKTCPADFLSNMLQNGANLVIQHFKNNWPSQVMKLCIEQKRRIQELHGQRADSDQIYQHEYTQYQI